MNINTNNAKRRFRDALKISFLIALSMAIIYAIIGRKNKKVIEGKGGSTQNVPRAAAAVPPNPFQESGSVADYSKKKIGGSRQSLKYIYENYNNTRQFHHWKEFAPHYELHLNLLMRRLDMSQEFRMLEIGVRFGGSIEVWKTYFSKMNLYYAGLDIDHRCKRLEDKTRKVFIEIGSQASQNVLNKICKEHGPFHFIVDDGGHTFDQMKTSIDTLFPSDLCMTRDSLYVIEDMHTMIHKDYQGAQIPGIPAEIFRRMHYYWYQWPNWKRALELNQLLRPDESDKMWADRIESISLYDSMMFVHRGIGSGPLTDIFKGQNAW